MPRKTTREIGNTGEDIACQFLTEKGWQILARNYYAGHSEIDIIAKEGGIYVFIEVKLRASIRYGHPVEYVTPEKVEHVFGAAEHWMREQQLAGKPMRFDVIGILKSGSNPPDITHLKDAYR